MTFLMISFWINLTAPMLFFPFDLVSVHRKCHQTLVLKGFLFLYFSVHQPRDFGGKNREISMCMSKRIPLSFRKFFLERIHRWGYRDRTYRSGSVSKGLLYWRHWWTFSIEHFSFIWEAFVWIICSSWKICSDCWILRR